PWRSHRNAARLHQLKQGLRDLELPLADHAADLCNVSRAVDSIEDDSKVVGKGPVGKLFRDVLVRRDALAKVLRLVHSADTFHEEAAHRNVLARREPRLLEAVQEIEGSIADEQRRVEDLFRLLADELEELLTRQEPELHRSLPESDLGSDRLRR